MKGIAASPGIAIGEAYLLQKAEIVPEEAEISADAVEAEVQRVREAQSKTKVQIEEIRKDTSAKLGQKKGEIFSAHLAMLEDPILNEKVLDNVKTHRMNGQAALSKAVAEIGRMFDQVEDEYLRERAGDLQDVGSRWLANLAGMEMLSLNPLDKEVILVSKDLTPSDTSSLDREKVLGLVTELGGRTSHTAIIARTLEIPAVVGTGNITARLKGGEKIVVDGCEGTVVINPTKEELLGYLARKEKFVREKEQLAALTGLPAMTKDGRLVELAANIGTPRDVEAALRNGAQGIGLYRTEFLYLDREREPTEDEQLAAYQEVAVQMGSRPVIIRTLDIGGDKEIPYLDFPKEDNPFLGWRGLRMCLDRPEILKTQLRAILRASSFGTLLIMYPMISSVDEVRKANGILAEVKKEMLEQGLPFDREIKVGIMVETPAAAMIADSLAGEVDFFSIGTNDLTQYTLAVDRGNAMIEHLYQPLHPAVLRLIKQVIDASHRAGKWTGMCGELAGNERAAAILLGMGLDEFSMSAGSIPRIKRIIRNLSYEKMKDIANQALNLATPDEVISFADSVMKNWAG